MNSYNLTPELEASLAEEFNDLKRSAGNVRDVANWFKKHPYLVPDLHSDMYDKLVVDIAGTDIRCDFFHYTTLSTYCVTFSLEEYNAGSTENALSRITQLNFNVNLQPEHAFKREHDIELDACEWRFVAIELLADLDIEELDKPSRKSLYKNILAAHYPDFHWPTFMNLVYSELLPRDADAMEAMLSNQVATGTDIKVPGDISP